MTRRYADPRLQVMYDACRARPPARHGNVLGQAFFWGYDHPEAPPSPARCGLPQSMTHAAWAAGVDCRREDDAEENR